MGICSDHRYQLREDIYYEILNGRVSGLKKVCGQY